MVMTNIARVQKNIDDLKEISEPCNGGVTRIGFTPKYREGVEYIKCQMREAGLEIIEDDVGNIYGRLVGKNPQLPAILSGSHLDTVRNAGAFDGIAGVVAALEVARMLKENGIQLNHTFEVVGFIEEEGTRFGIVLLGSRFISGEFTEKDRDRISSENGDTLRDVLQTYSSDYQVVPTRRHPETIKAFVELHDEQGPLLENTQSDIGIVDNIVSIGQMVIHVHGFAGHAGTVPMTMRQDAGVAGNLFATQITKYVVDNYPKIATVTIGKFTLEPGSANCIPCECRFTLDIRSGTSTIVQDIIRYIHREGVKIAKRCSVEIDTDEISFKQPVEMDSTLKDIIKHICKERNLTWQHMSSGAGHDAMIMAGISRSAMIFVPCEKGITHHPAERVFWDDMEKGVNVLFNTILKIDSL